MKGNARQAYRVIDLPPEHESVYFKCLEDWSDDIKEAGGHKELWYRRMKDRGLGVKIALNAEGRVGGMIQYIPIERSAAEGRDLYFITCVWVHGHKKGIGNVQKRGMGQALLRAAEEDIRARGAKGVAAWGVSLPFWMRASWFKKHGYRPVDKVGMMVLVWKPFAEDAEPPRWIREKKRPELVDGKVAVTAFLNGWCPAMNMTYERAKRAAAEIGDGVAFRTVDTFDRAVIEEWGIMDALFIDGKALRTGPPPSYKKVYKAIKKRV
jgi:N-acetylglutamate synthase-like GNAT family acetyltransferase